MTIRSGRYPATGSRRRGVDAVSLSTVGDDADRNHRRGKRDDELPNCRSCSMTSDIEVSTLLPTQFVAARNATPERAPSGVDRGSRRKRKPRHGIPGWLPGLRTKATPSKG